MFEVLAITLDLVQEGLQESLWRNGAGLAISVIVGVIVVLLVFRFLRKTIFRIIVLVLVVAVVGLFVLRVRSDVIKLDDLKSWAQDCGLTMRGDGSWELDKSCIIPD